MILTSNVGQFDFNRPKVRLDGRVLDKYSLISVMRGLDSHFYWRLMYAMDTHTYQDLREELIEYLTEC